MLAIGPARSGKTRLVLDALERAIRAQRSAEVQLLVPTSSMRHHLLAQLARKGLAVPARVIATMSALVASRTPGLREATAAQQERLLDAALQTVNPPGKPGLSPSTGLRRQVSRVAAEFWAAGASSWSVQSLARTGLQQAFQKVFLAYEEGLRAADLVHHNQRIALAATHIRDEGLDPVRSVYVDGFDRFTKPQEVLLEALAEQAEEIIVTLPPGLRHYPLGRLAQKVLAPQPGGEVATETMAAPSPRQEILQVARRILGSRRPPHDHGIILRSAHPYVPLIREIFGALELPFRFWGLESAVDHGVVRHFLQWLRVIERGFPGGPALEALLSPLTPAGAAADLDTLDFEVRERLPGDGLGFLGNATRSFEAPSAFLEGLRYCEKWPTDRVDASVWRKRCRELLQRVQALPVPVGGASSRRLQDWRQAISARRVLVQAMEETSTLAGCQTGERLDLPDFIAALEEVLHSATLGEAGQAHEVVQVLPIHESRQWSLPVVFVCGLAEGWFPRRHSEDSFFDDTDRRRLAAQGVELRTAVERTAEERFLFEAATSRATSLLVLSHPLQDSSGRQLVRSRWLTTAGEEQRATWIAGESRRQPHPPRPPDTLPRDLRPTVARFNPHFSVSGIAAYRQCPYLYFSGSTLRLRGRPPLPEHRLDGRAIGSIVHSTLRRWNEGRGDIGDLLDSSFGAALKRLHLPNSYRTEQVRLALRADLVRFAEEQGAGMGVPGGGPVHFEVAREYRIEELQGQPVVQCRIDRYELDHRHRCFVTDYKYARPQRVRAMLREHLLGRQLQLTTYLAALEQQMDLEPGGMALCGLRGETTYLGAAVSGPGGFRLLSKGDMRSLLEGAREETALAAGAILAGAIPVQPRDRSYCTRICEFGSVCRVHWTTGGEPAGSGGEGKA